MRHLFIAFLLALLVSCAKPRREFPAAGTYLLEDSSAALILSGRDRLDFKMELWVHPSCQGAMFSPFSIFQQFIERFDSELDKFVTDSLFLYVNGPNFSATYGARWLDDDNSIPSLVLTNNHQEPPFIFSFMTENINRDTTMNELLRQVANTPIRLSTEHEFIQLRDTMEEPEPAKPVIYLYPVNPIEVDVQLRLSARGFAEGSFYPEPDSQGIWRMLAHPNGIFRNRENGYEYPSLFWEAPVPFYPESQQFQDGWLVSRDSLSSVFEAQLQTMGFNPNERTEFIQYWLPRLGEHQHVFIHFAYSGYSAVTGPITNVTGEQYEAAAPLVISPKPDEWLRVLLLWYPASGNAPIPAPQTLPSLRRTGFYGLEWGGTIVNAPALGI